MFRLLQRICYKTAPLSYTINNRILSHTVRADIKIPQLSPAYPSISSSDSNYLGTQHSNLTILPAMPVNTRRSRSQAGRDMPITARRTRGQAARDSQAHIEDDFSAFQISASGWPEPNPLTARGQALLDLEAEDDEEDVEDKEDVENDVVEDVVEDGMEEDANVEDEGSEEERGPEEEETIEDEDDEDVMDEEEEDAMDKIEDLEADHVQQEKPVADSSRSQASLPGRAPRNNVWIPQVRVMDPVWQATFQNPDPSHPRHLPPPPLYRHQLRNPWAPDPHGLALWSPSFAPLNPPSARSSVNAPNSHGPIEPFPARPGLWQSSLVATPLAARVRPNVPRGTEPPYEPSPYSRQFLRAPGAPIAIIGHGSIPHPPADDRSEPRLCTSARCGVPATIAHYRHHLYRHNGRRCFTPAHCPWGYGNPPSAVWQAWERTLDADEDSAGRDRVVGRRRRASLQADCDLVDDFSAHHGFFPPGMDREGVVRWAEWARTRRLERP